MLSHTTPLNTDATKNVLTHPLPMQARYCIKCKDFRPLASFPPPLDDDAPGCIRVKLMQNSLCNRHEHDDEEKERFCKKCNAFSPVCNFAAGEKSYTCNTHKYLRADKEKNKRHRDQPEQKRKMRPWRLCYNDRIKFKQSCINLKPNDIESLLQKIDPTLQTVCEVVPKDPLLIVSMQNFVVINDCDRNPLLRHIKNKNNQAYANMLPTITLLDSSLPHIIHPP